MRILITGASGFIGSHLTQFFLTQGHSVTACVREPTMAINRWPGIKFIAVDFNNDHSVFDWQARLSDIDVVINAVGIIRETRGQTFDALHYKTPVALFRACELAGIRRVIQISALGADETASSAYHLSKRLADKALMQLKLNWTIALPSIVYGPGAKSMAFFKAWAALPLIPLVDAGDQPVQPIHINDLVNAISQLISPQAPSHLRIEMVGPHAITMKTMFTRLRQWLALPRGRFLQLPYSLCLQGARLGGFLGSTPISRETAQMLQRGNTGDVTPFVKHFGFTPMSFEQALEHTPAQQADRWHAELYFLNPLLRYSIALLWLYTGMVSAFVFPAEQSYALLSAAGINMPWATFALYGAAAIDIFFALALLLQYRLRLIASLQIVLILYYTVVISLTLPQYWLHPFGPISKNLPLVVATLIMVAMSKR